MNIVKKIWPESFENILNNKKTFELRLNDFNVHEGDILVLKEWDPETQEYTGREVEKEVLGISRFKLEELEKFWSRKEIDDNGIQIISIK